MRKSKLFIRKFFVVIIGIVLCFTSLTACGNNPDDENPTDSLVFQEEASGTIKEVDQSNYVTFYFDAENGVFLCEDCFSTGVREILPDTARALGNIADDKPSDTDSVKYALKFLNYYYRLKTGEYMYSIDQLLALP